MVAISIGRFQAQAPRVDRHLLATEQSASCTNVDLRTGAIYPLRRPTVEVPVATTAGVYVSTGTRVTAQRAVKLITSTGTTQWWLSSDPMGSILRSPVSNDASDRVYFTEAGQVPKMNTMARLGTNDVPYPLGLPQPSTLSGSVTGGSASNITRVYVVTYLTTFGEEGPPSEAFTLTGPSDGTWTITGYPTTNPDPTRPIYALRFYRSELTSGILRYVHSETFTASVSWVDNIGETTLALRARLPSASWSAPVATLQGLVGHPAGFFAGFSGRDVYFSEKYLPHAWPPGYALRVQHPIVALAVFGDNIAVLTKGPPVVLVGSDPLTMSPIVLGEPSPCLAARSVVVDDDFVYYATTEGLARLSVAGVETVSAPFVTKEEWNANWFVPTMRAVRWNGYYMALTNESRGFLFSPAVNGFIQLAYPRDRQGIDVAADNGEVHLLETGNIEIWMKANVNTGWLTWSWTSKTFLTPKPINLGAVQVRLPDENYGSAPDASSPQQQMLDYNAARIASGPLDCLNLYVLGGEVATPAATGDLDQPPVQPLGGEPLYEPYRGAGVTLRVFLRDQLEWEQPITGEHTRRLPAYAKGSRWAFELTGNEPVLAIHAAETAQELASV